MADWKNRALDRLGDQAPLVRGLQWDRREEGIPTPEQFKRERLDGYDPHEGQLEVHSARDCDRVMGVAGRRGGKTYCFAREFCLRVIEDYHRLRLKGEAEWSRPDKITDRTKPLLRYWLVAPTYELTGYQIREIYEVFGGDNSPLIIKDSPGKKQLWLRGGILIEQKSGDRPKQLVAAGIHGVWADEVARLKEDVWENNVRPTLTDYEGWGLFSTTPLGVSNWDYRRLWSNTEYVETEDEPDLLDWKGVKFHTADNTAVPAIQREVERAREELSDALFRRNYLADYFAFEGQIFDEFVDDEPHIVRKIPFLRFVRRIGAVDWGFSNPGCILEIGIDDQGVWWIYREHYEEGRTVVPAPDSGPGGTWLENFQAAQQNGVEQFWADPSQPETIEQLRQRDVPLDGAENAVKPGIDAVSAMLRRASGTPAVRIHRSCTHLRNELASYRWGDDGEPVKEDDHTVDALRYAVLSEFRHGSTTPAGLEGFSIFSDGPYHEAAA